jgi:hypothetical protein
MSAWVIVIIVAAVVLVVLLLVAWRGIERRRRVAAMNPRERELYEAEKQHEAAVDLALKTLERTEETWSRRVKKAEDAVAEAHRVGSRPLGSFQKIDLFEDHIVTPEGAFRFENGPVEAVVDTARTLASAREASLSRAGKEVLESLASLGSGPEGMQALYLLVETPIFVTVTEVKADDEVKARQFLHSINSAASSVVSNAEAGRQAIAQAQADLDQTISERDAAVAAAQSELAVVKADTRRIDTARSKIQPPKPSPPGGGAPPPA